MRYVLFDPDWNILADTSFGLGNSQAAALGHQDERVVELALDTRKQIEVRLAFDENALRLRSLTRQEDHTGHTLTTEDNHMSLTWLGEDTYIVVFNDRAASSTNIHLQLLHADDVLYERSLATRAR